MKPPPSNDQTARNDRLTICALIGVMLIAAVCLLATRQKSTAPVPTTESPANPPPENPPWLSVDPGSSPPPPVVSPVVDHALALREQRMKDPRLYLGDPLYLWWDAIPTNKIEDSIPTGPESNMHKPDYAGAESCRECHEENYAHWSEHPHRWMNASASKQTIKGDFSGVSINYRGGQGTFFKQGDSHRMRLQRGDTNQVYEIRETIGSRFYQYYVGRMIEGALPKSHPNYSVNHVLPFGYWLDRKEWVPAVHVSRETPESERLDMFDTQLSGERLFPYAKGCNYCHNTFPLGDDMMRKPRQMAQHAPVKQHWHVGGYLIAHHSNTLSGAAHPADLSPADLEQLLPETLRFEASEHAVNSGITCEACHLGSKKHAEDSSMLPSFHPQSPFLRIESEKASFETGRTHQNLNWACSRCHTGLRPLYAGGMSTWNSTEYTDATKGSCYSQLQCVDCHNPHKATGVKWTDTPRQDDARCVRCHEQYTSSKQIEAHTHHPMTSEGARCMNCHMPRINEGMQDLVRTHTIFSPTNKKMIEANHPNACNQCHTEKPIDWTLTHLKDWYGRTFDESAIANAYPDRNGSTAENWVKSPNKAVRLVGADSLFRARSLSSLPLLIDALDDPNLLNRQFARIGFQQMLKIDLDPFGYRFYQTPDERKAPLQAMRKSLLKPEEKAPPK